MNSKELTSNFILNFKNRNKNLKEKNVLSEESDDN
jgi:hypothetical protein